MAQGTKNIPATYVVTQSNELIEADYSASKLTVNAMKIAKLVVAKISPSDQELRLVRIKNATIKQYFGYKTASKYNRFYNDIKVACERLNDQAISIELPTGNTLNAFFISSWEIDNNTDETVFEISGRLKPYLLQLKSNYTTYQLRNIPKLTSTYSIRFYELLCRYRRIGKRQFEVEELKKKVGCSYPSYGHFKKKALLKAQEHLLKSTDLHFEFEEMKTGRKVTSIIFFIYPNDPESGEAQQVLPFLEEEFAKNQVEPFSKEVVQTFLNIGIKEATLEKMLAEGFDIIKEAGSRAKAVSRCRTIDQYYVEKLTLLRESKQKKNPAGFFIKAVKEDWLKPKSSGTRSAGKSLNQKRKELETVEKQLKKIEGKYEVARQEQVDAFFAENPDMLLPILEQIGKQYRIMLPYLKPLLSDPESYKEEKSVVALLTVAVEKIEPTIFVTLKETRIEIEALKSKIKSLK
jgi:plasmid replication initiation protein